MYSWSTFLNRVRFLNFWHFYDPIFKQISEATFFMIITIYWYFIHCEEKEFCSFSFVLWNEAHSQPVTRQHWLAFRNYVWKNLSEFSKNLSTKSTISQKIEIGKLFFHRFQNIAHLFGPKTQLIGNFGGGRLRGDLHLRSP